MLYGNVMWISKILGNACFNYATVGYCKIIYIHNIYIYIYIYINIYMYLADQYISMPKYLYVLA